jgi:hypothetical protein
MPPLLDMSEYARLEPPGYNAKADGVTPPVGDQADGMHRPIIIVTPRVILLCGPGKHKAEELPVND